MAPLFRCLARAIDRDGGRGVEIASRLGYDDVNECFCRRDVVHQVPHVQRWLQEIMSAAYATRRQQAQTAGSNSFTCSPFGNAMHKDIVDVPC